MKYPKSVLRFSRTRWFLVWGIVVFSAWGLSAQPLKRVSISTWSGTTYYLGFAGFEARIDGRIRITAGDRYTVYLNGDLVGTDENPRSVETYTVSFRRGSNTVAVVAEHGKTLGGYGLFCVLEAEDVLFVSSPTDRTTPWFWTDHLLENQARERWTRLGINDLTRHEESGEPVVWRPVQAGTLDPRTFPEFADLNLTHITGVAGFPGGLDGSQGGLRLRSFEGQNLAYSTFSADPKLIDGNINTPVSFRKGVSVLLQEVEIDLGRLFPVNRVRVITQPPTLGTYEDASLRGYSILVSKDGVHYVEVGSQNRITTYEESEVVFPTVSARHVRLTITEFANRNASPRVGEVEVYGEGIEQQGTYTSPPSDLGTAETKNFDRGLWFGDTPPNAEMDLRFRSGDDGTTWSAWSAWSHEPEIPLTVPEPRRYLQFQVRMQTQDLYVGPRLDSLVVLYSIESLPATRAVASVSPARVPIGVDTTFTYTLELDVRTTDAGVGRLVILTPWPAQMNLNTVQGLSTAGIDREHTSTTNDSLVIVFDPPISSRTGTTKLIIPFTSRLLSASHTFQGMLYAPGASLALLVQEREGTDPLTGFAYSVTTEAADFAIPILSDVQAYPPIFSPNGDGVNDYVILGFTLGRVSGAPVRIKIYDLGGTLVWTLPERRLDAGRYAPVTGGEPTLPGYWNGRGDSGSLLPPGVYLYRIVVDIEPDNETAGGVVGIVY